jgi:hypothetical protein
MTPWSRLWPVLQALDSALELGGTPTISKMGYSQAVLSAAINEHLSQIAIDTKA